MYIKKVIEWIKAYQEDVINDNQLNIVLFLKNGNSISINSLAFEKETILLKSGDILSEDMISHAEVQAA